MATIDQVVGQLQQQVTQQAGRIAMLEDEVKNLGNGVVALRKIFGGGDDKEAGSRPPRLNYAASKDLKPNVWHGVDDKNTGYAEYRAEFVNYMDALHPDSSALMKEIEELGVGQSANIDDLINYEKDLTEAIDRALYSMLFSTTRGTARQVVQGAGQGKGLQAWHDLAHYGAPKSTTDRTLSVQRLLKPEMAQNEGDLQLKLATWLRAVADHESRFGKLDEDIKRVGLQAVVPRETYRARFVGETFKTFDDMLAKVKGVAADRSAIAYAEGNKRAKTGGPKDDPMEIGEIDDETQTVVWQVASSLKGKWGKSKGSGK